MQLVVCRLVTPTSKCLLRIYSHSTFRRDTVLGEGRLDIQKQLVRVQGKFDKTSLIIDIKVVEKTLDLLRSCNRVD